MMTWHCLYWMFVLLCFHESSDSFRLLKHNKIHQLDLKPREKQRLSQVNGFYGLIGPNVDSKRVKTLYDLFMGDGVIQGVFFDKGNLTFVKHLVETEKVKHEMRFGDIVDHPLILIVHHVLYKLFQMPNMMGYANTALMNIKKKIYACYERDYPYLMEIDMEDKKIRTLEKKPIQNVEYFSAHSKTNDKEIETIDYDMMKRQVNYYCLDMDFSLKEKLVFPLKYMPMVHDFYADERKIILVDGPMEMDMQDVWHKKMPISLHSDKDTYFYVYDKVKKERTTYVLPKRGMYIFHYEKVYETDKYIEIYAPCYEKINFSDLNLHGKYRCIRLDKMTQEVTVIENKELEKYNLDFPICYDKNKVVLRNIDIDDEGRQHINGFVVCDGLRITKTIFYEEREIMGEHRIVKLGRESFLVFFNYHKGKYYITFSKVENPKDVIDVEIPERIELGFHSIYIDK